MTKSQCYSEISRNKQLISQYHNQINTLNREINELEDARSKMSILKSTLVSCKNSSVNRMSGTSLVMKINSKIINKFCNNMNTLFEGAEYRSINNGLGNGIMKIEDEIKIKRNQINSLNNQILDCNDRISNMNSTIKKIEAQEREEARRRAEEERRAQEARNN